MTQEEKKLLLRDIPARLPYRIKVEISYNKEHGSSDRLRICSEGCLILNTDVFGLFIENEIYIKPYLRPMSSMTEEEYEEYAELRQDISDKLKDWKCADLIDWLNKHHFDYHGLVERGLALKAPEGMYNN